jgi:hypothetical protein
MRTKMKAGVKASIPLWHNASSFGCPLLLFLFMLKQTTLSVLLLAAALPTLAQTTPATSLQASGGPVVKAPYQFCVLNATELSFGKPSFTLDYGPKTNTLKRSETQAYDEQWKVDGLASFADALNFMTAKGWDFVSSNAVLNEKGVIQYQYIFRRSSGQ